MHNLYMFSTVIILFWIVILALYRRMRYAPSHTDDVERK